MTKDLKRTISALYAANSALRDGFIWRYSPEGHAYWSAQAHHMVSLAEQLEADKEAYRD